MSGYLLNPPKKGLLGYTSFFERPEYRFELWGKDKKGNPLFKWFNEDKGWVDANHHGHGLPKNALKYISHSATNYQKTYADEHGEPPWEFHQQNVNAANDLLK